MEPAAYLGALESNGISLAAAAEGNLGALVPSCPGWNVGELVWHTGGVHHFWRTIAERRLQDWREVQDPQRPEDSELLAWYGHGLRALVETLESVDPSQQVWTWAPRGDIAFIQRRMAHETAVHRWDAQAAAGEPDPLEPELAVDGIDEFLDFMLPADPARLAEGGESVHLHSTDAPGEWVITVTKGKLEVARTHGKGDVAARGPASDLLLLLWRRVSPSAVEVIGDDPALERFLARADLD
jgi:uncharacterized protein (TIGR03083 family)